MAGKSAGAVRIGPVALAIAVVIAAYGAFRVYGGAAPFGPEIAKLALWVLLPLAVVMIQMRGNLVSAMNGIGLRPPFLRALVPGLLAMLAAGGTLFLLGAPPKAGRLPHLR